MKFIQLIAAAALTTALVAGGSVAASAAPSDSASTDTAASDCNFGQHVVAAWRQLPAELQADLKALRALPQGERRDAAIAIREKALAGDYGTGTQQKALWLKDRRALALQTMPIELKQALMELRNTDPADRRELARQIADDALAGTYGPQAQQTVEEIRASDFWQNCVAE